VISPEIACELEKLARPVGAFDAQQYFRGNHKLRFYNIGTERMRAFARSVYEVNRDQWPVDDAMALADELIADPYLETKSVGDYLNPWLVLGWIPVDPVEDDIADGQFGRCKLEPKLSYF
jgi:hypothetical protein